MGKRGVKATDRIIFRNRRGRLCHGIVQIVLGGELFVEESVPVEPRKASSVHDEGIFQDGESWHIVAVGEIVRMANLK